MFSVQERQVIIMEFRKILVPVDGSNPSIDAFRTGADLALKYGAELEVVTVINFNNEQPILSLGNLEKFTEEGLQKQGMAVIDSVVKDVPENVKLTKVVLYGDPAKAIIEEQETGKADCIILGSRGLGSVRRFFIGSVSTEIVHNAECPVFVIR